MGFGLGSIVTRGLNPQQAAQIMQRLLHAAIAISTQFIPGHVTEQGYSKIASCTTVLGVFKVNIPEGAFTEAEADQYCTAINFQN